MVFKVQSTLHYKVLCGLNVPDIVLIKALCGLSDKAVQYSACRRHAFLRQATKRKGEDHWG